MPVDFVLKSIVKSAVRTFTAPIVSAETFDSVIASLLVTENNPLGAAVTKSTESYGATIAYIEETEGATVGTVTLRGKTRAAINASVTAALADTALQPHSAGTPCRTRPRTPGM